MAVEVRGNGKKRRYKVMRGKNICDMWFEAKLWKKILFLMPIAFGIVYLIFIRTTPIDLHSENISEIYIGMHCMMTEEIIDGRASIKKEENIENAVHALNRIVAKRGRYSMEELSGEPPQATITCYDHNGKQIEEINFYDNFVMVDKTLYKISKATYRKLSQLCEEYGECRFIE